VTRDLPPEEEKDTDPPEGPAGHVRTTSVGALVGFALTGLVLGWLLRPASIRINGKAPLVTWTPVLALVLVAVILGAVALVTYRDLRRRGQRLEPHKAVNRLVLAKSCALAGAMVAGGYFGYALSWWGVSEAALARERVVQSLAAGVASVFIVAGSLLLERACRVRDDNDTDLG
jgi:small-conductance mechanosensitive channel